MWKSRSPSWAPRPKYSRYGLCGRTATLNWTLATTQRLAYIFKSTAKLEAVYILRVRLPAPSICVSAPCPVKREVGRTSGAFKCSFVLVWQWPTCSHATSTKACGQVPTTLKLSSYSPGCQTSLPTLIELCDLLFSGVQTHGYLIYQYLSVAIRWL